MFMESKLLRVLRTVFIVFAALITIGLIFLVCCTGPFNAVWIFAIVGLAACIFCKCIHLGIHSIFKNNLPNWYIVPAFKNKLRILCFAASLILFFVSVTVCGRMLGENTILASLGAVSGIIKGIAGKNIGKFIAYIKGMIGVRIAFTETAVRSAIWGL